ncbi:hypothetical protein K438DRAFT_1959531 [Mycena galopus ATCC 62051]|nr:hypothetical protein K438DRAFT_1959531 [Mycena galopus ATCC 62051]
MEQLVKPSKEPGFTGSILPGVSVSKERQVPEAHTGNTEGDVEMSDATLSSSPTNPATSGSPPLPPQDTAGNADDEDTDVDGEAVADAYEVIARMAHNTPALGF